MTHLQLIYFVAVAEQLNLTRVAEQFHVSQPAVSAAIRDIEKEFRHTLFERRRNELVLTPDGERTYHHAKALLLHFNEFYSLVSSDLVAKNTCSFSFSPNVATLYLADLYLYAKKNLPDFTVSMQEETIANMTHMLKNNLLDSACFSCSDNQKDSALTYVPVGKMVLSMCAHPRVFYSEDIVIPISALKDIPIVLQWPTSQQNIYARKAFREAGLIPNIIYESRQTSSLCTMVRRGIALGCFMPASLFQNDRDIRVYQCQDQEAFTIYLVYKDKTPDVTILLRLVKDFFHDIDTTGIPYLL